MLWVAISGLLSLPCAVRYLGDTHHSWPLLGKFDAKVQVPQNINHSNEELCLS